MHVALLLLLMPHVSVLLLVPAGIGHHRLLSTFLLALLLADTRAVEFLASQLALSRLQLLDFTRVRDGQARCLPDNICWCGPEPFPSSPLAAAAMLQRMVAR